jgi:hypothetical protein
MNDYELEMDQAKMVLLLDIIYFLACQPDKLQVVLNLALISIAKALFDQGYYPHPAVKKQFFFF